MKTLLTFLACAGILGCSHKEPAKYSKYISFACKYGQICEALPDEAYAGVDNLTVPEGYYVVQSGKHFEVVKLGDERPFQIQWDGGKMTITSRDHSQIEQISSYDGKPCQFTSDNMSDCKFEVIK